MNHRILIGRTARGCGTAALALCTCDPSVVTGRITYSLSLLVELNRAVSTLDGASLVPGWQPHEIARSRLRAGYLAES